MPESSHKFREPNQAEKLVAARIRSFRRAKDLSQWALAKEVGLTRDQIASIELARVQLPLRVALEISRVLHASLAWIAEGYGPPPHYINPPWQNIPKTSFTKPFLQEYERVLRPLYRHKIDESFPGKVIFQPLSKIEKMEIRLGLMGSSFEQVAEDLPNRLGAILDLCPPNLKAELFQKINDVLKDFTQNHDCKLRESSRLRASERHVEKELLAVGKPTVDIQNPLANVGGVSSQYPNWKQLVSELREKTKSLGAKSQLAKDLNTSRQNVNKWLSGKGAPSAELALEVLRWVRKR